MYTTLLYTDKGLTGMHPCWAPVATSVLLGTIPRQRGGGDAAS